ncbi:hypothetical protein KFE25_002327 [Diacronema lutheri]|uniref:glucan endo-1,3-beta-D-glucosidase n=1 Tax=Diacronema lutheri TaxID=2081491 RepID=A0A8J5X767_DIALT|nr:hypothetical protein KFE25_002327 [Diacronema lutheri]
MPSYHLFAAAVAAKLDPAWGVRQRERLLLYARDIANPSTEDRFFPVWRHKDWFTGWSWASGIALGGGKPYRNGRNQESTSESIHAYYGLQLLGDALGDNAMRDWGRAALAAEVLAAQTYWQMPQSSDVYPHILRKKTLLGILWQNLAQYQTWFGGSPYMVHGIQMVPFSPASEFYLQRGFVNESFPIGNSDCEAQPGCERDGWSTLFVMQLAILDPAKAWERAMALPDLVFSGEAPAGNGNSRTATLFWIATRADAHVAPGARGSGGGARGGGGGGAAAAAAALLRAPAWPRRLACSALPVFDGGPRSSATWWALVCGALMLALLLCGALVEACVNALHELRARGGGNGAAGAFGAGAADSAAKDRLLSGTEAAEAAADMSGAVPPESGAVLPESGSERACTGACTSALAAARLWLVRQWARTMAALSTVGALFTGLRARAAAHVDPAWAERRRARCQLCCAAARDGALALCLALGAALGSARAAAAAVGASVGTRSRDVWVRAKMWASIVLESARARAVAVRDALVEPSAAGRRRRLLVGVAVLVVLLAALACVSTAAAGGRPGASVEVQRLAPPPSPPSPMSPPPRYEPCAGGGECDATACGGGGVAQCCRSGAVCPRTVCPKCNCPDCSGFGGAS